MQSGTPSFGAISTGNLLADCERWCRDHLPPRVPASRRATALRVVRDPRPAPARPGPCLPGLPLERTGT